MLECKEAKMISSKSLMTFILNLNKNETLTNIFLEGPYRFKHVSLKGIFRSNGENINKSGEINHHYNKIREISSFEMDLAVMYTCNEHQRNSYLGLVGLKSMDKKVLDHVQYRDNIRSKNSYYCFGNNPSENEDENENIYQQPYKCYSPIIVTDKKYYPIDHFNELQNNPYTIDVTENLLIEWSKLYDKLKFKFEFDSQYSINNNNFRLWYHVAINNNLI